MKKNKITKLKSKYRIVKFTKTLHNNTEEYRFELQKRGLFGKWKTAFIDSASMAFPMIFESFEEAEKAYEDNFLKPNVTVVKEYFE